MTDKQGDLAGWINLRSKYWLYAKYEGGIEPCSICGFTGLCDDAGVCRYCRDVEAGGQDLKYNQDMQEVLD